MPGVVPGLPPPPPPPPPPLDPLPPQATMPPAMATKRRTSDSQEHQRRWVPGARNRIMQARTEPPASQPAPGRNGLWSAAVVGAVVLTVSVAVTGFELVI